MSLPKAETAYPNLRTLRTLSNLSNLSNLSFDHHMGSRFGAYSAIGFLYLGF